MELNIHSPLPVRKDFRIGILGAGFIVNDCHLVAYRKAGFNPVAISSRTRAGAEKVAQRHGIPKVYDAPEQLLDDPSVEVLDIAVPPMHQLGLIKAACQRKTVKGILAQKPLGMNYREAVEAVAACEKAGIVLAVNQNMRYDQSVRAARTLLENGTIGEPVFATIDMRGIPHWMDWHKDLGWLTLRIMSIHHLDMFRYWFGDPEGIYCSVRTDPRTKFQHKDGICTYILEYANGLRCVGIDDTWSGPAKEGCPADIRIEWRIEGTKGVAVGDIGWCKDPYTSPSTIRYAAIGDKDWHRPVWTESWFPDAFIGTMAQLLIALESGREPAISGRDNLKTMALVEAAYLSVAQFRSIGLDVIERMGGLPESIPPRKPLGFFGRLFSAPNLVEGTGVSSSSNADQAITNFTPRAQQALALARQEADRFNHNFVGTEHLLLGLIRLGQGVAVNVLNKMGLDLETVRTEVEKQVGAGTDQKLIGTIPYTPRVKKVLALAAKEAKALNHTYVGTEHVLLGLLCEGDSVAARVLTNLKVDAEKTRREILKELDPNFDGSDEGK
jgi:predicted dehydrogenase